MSTICIPTYQSVELASNEGRKFLRKVIKTNLDATWLECWSARASLATEWKLVFHRTIKGNIGEPDQEVEVRTDCEVRMPHKTGMSQSFSDSKPVYVCAVRYVHFTSSGETAALADLLLRDCRLSVCASSGSTSSSHHGLSFYHVDAQLPGNSYAGLQIGGTTVAKDGKQIVAAAVEIN